MHPDKMAERRQHQAERAGYTSWDAAVLATLDLSSKKAAKVLGVYADAIEEHRREMSQSNAHLSHQERHLAFLDQKALDAGYLGWDAAIRATAGLGLGTTRSVLDVPISMIRQTRRDLGLAEKKELPPPFDMNDPDDPRHGASSYARYGCRCEVCKAGKKEQMAQWHRDSRSKSTPYEHGVGGYTNYGCRCKICKTAQQAQRKEWKARKFAVLSADPNHPEHGRSTGRASGCKCAACRAYGQPGSAE